MKLHRSVLHRLLFAALALAPVAARAAIQDELVAHLTFDDSLQDSSGRGLHGTAVGNPMFVEGRVGSKAIGLSSKPDGSGFNYVTLGAPAELNFGTDTDFSVSFWVRFKSWKFDPPFIGNKDWGSGQNQGWMVATGTDGRLQWNYGGGPGLRKDYDGPAGTVSDGLWHHVAVTFLRAGEVVTYLDGQVVDEREVTASLNNISTATGLAVNIGQDGTGRYTDGGTVGVDDLAMDDVGIWRRVLTGSEVTAVYQAGLTGSNLATVVSSAQPPVLSTGPRAQDAIAGNDVVFKVLPRGSSPFTFRWFKGGAPIENATGAILRLSNVQAGDAGAYAVEVRNAAGVTNSAPVELTVDASQAPAITLQPRSSTSAPGGAAEFKTAASGVSPLTFQWYRDGQPVTGATQPNLFIARAAATDAGSYALVVKAGNGLSSTSAVVALTLVSDIKQNLVAHLTFDTDYSDASGRGNDGRAVGAPSIVPGRIGNGALRFTHNGTEFNYVTLGTPDDLDFSVDADFSFAFWVRFSLWNRDPVLISNKSWTGSGANIGYALAIGADGRFQWNFREQVGERADYDTQPGLISDGQWHHVGVTFQRGGDARTFIDGVLVDTQPLPTSETTIQPGFPTNLGQDGTGTYSEAGQGRIDDGTLDDVAVWRRAITAEEMATIYRKGLTAGANVQEKALTDGLLVHLPFDGSYEDQSGRNNHATAVGNPGFGSGKIGSGALAFSSAANGSAFNYATLGRPADLDFGRDTDFTVALWVKFTKWTGDPAFIGNKDWTSGGNQGWVIATAGNGRLQWNVADGDAGGRTRYDYDGPAGTISDGQWHHVAVTFDLGGRAVSYLDGNPVSTNAIAPDLASISTPTGLRTNIGQDGRGNYTDNNAVGISDGQIDDVGIWARVLEPAEVRQIVDRGMAGLNLSNQRDAAPVLTRATTQPPAVLHTQNGVNVFDSGYGSSLARDPNDPNLYYMMTDRGPNFDTADLTGKVFPLPDYAPRIGVFRRVGSELIKQRDILLSDADGSPLNGLPNPVGEGGTGEKALDLAGTVLTLSVKGIDPEGLARAADGSFWICDEYGPHILHVDANGKTLERINPFGTGLGGRTLPRVFASRRANRGMEGLTLTPDGTKLVGIMQSPLDNPTSARSAIRANSRATRILVFDIATGASQQFVYLQERAGLLNSEIAAISTNEFLVLERDGNFPHPTNATPAFKRLYKIRLDGATDVSDAENSALGRRMVTGTTTNTLEQLSTLALLDAGVVPVHKELYVDLMREVPDYPHDKPEGIAWNGDGSVDVVNDDDYAIDTDGQGGIAGKRLPATGELDRNVLYRVRPTPVVRQGYYLQLVHSSDNESSFQDPNTLENKVLGYAAVHRGLALLAEREQIGSLHVTAGDHTLPGPFYRAAASAPLLGAAGLGDIAIYNALAVRANGIGNHEFDGGINDFARMLKAARYPFIAANLDFSKAQVTNGVPPIEVGVDGGSVEENAGKVVRSAYVEIRGEKIGLIGRAPASFFQVIQNPTATIPGVDFVGGRDAAGLPLASALPMVLEQVDLLKAKGINKIVLMDHAQDFTSDPLAATSLRDIDIVITAGSTGFYAQSKTDGAFNLLRSGDKPAAPYPLQRADANGKPILVVNSDQLYRYLGHLIVRFDDNGVIDWIDPRSGPVPTSTAGVAALSTTLLVPTLKPVAEVQTAFDALAATPLITDLNTVAGQTTQRLNGARADVRTRETNLGRLAADSTLWFANAHLAALNDPRQVDIALKNGGGIRDSIAGPAVTRFTIGAALAFNNQLAILELTAAELIAAVENGVSLYPAADGRFPQIAGALLEFDPAKPGLPGQATVEAPSRVRTLIVFRADGTRDVVVENYTAKGDLQRKFVLATNSFQATGGDSYESLKIASARGFIQTTIGEQQILADYIAGPLNGTVMLGEPLLAPRVTRAFAELNFLAWSQRFFTPGLVGSREADDFDGDGIPNFLEFVYGRNPTTRDQDARLVAPERRGDRLEVRFQRTKGSTVKWTYLAATTLDETAWRVLTPGVDVELLATDTGDGVEQVVLTLPQSAAESGFVLIRAE